MPIRVRSSDSITYSTIRAISTFANSARACSFLRTGVNRRRSHTSTWLIRNQSWPAYLQTCQRIYSRYSTTILIYSEPIRSEVHVRTLDFPANSFLRNLQQADLTRVTAAPVRVNTGGFHYGSHDQAEDLDHIPRLLALRTADQISIE